MADTAKGSQTRYWILLLIGVTVTPLLVVSIIILYQFREVALMGRATRVAHYDQPAFAWR